MHVQYLLPFLAILSASSIANAYSPALVQDDSFGCNIIGQFCVKLEDDTYTYGLSPAYNGVQRKCTTVEGGKGKGEYLVPFYVPFCKSDTRCSFANRSMPLL